MFIRIGDTILATEHIVSAERKDEGAVEVVTTALDAASEYYHGGCQQIIFRGEEGPALWFYLESLALDVAEYATARRKGIRA